MATDGSFHGSFHGEDHRGTHVVAADGGGFTAVASKFGSVANGERGPTTFARYAFDASVKRTPVVPLLWVHNEDEILGRARLWVEPNGDLLAAGVLSDDVAKAKEARSLLRMGAVSGISIGFIPEHHHTESHVGRSVRVVEQASVHEVSLVPWPADPSARVTEVHGRVGPGQMVPAVDYHTRIELAWAAAAMRECDPAKRESEFFRIVGEWPRW